MAQGPPRRAPALSTPPSPEAISCPIAVEGDGHARVFVNVGGLGPHCSLRVGLDDEGFSAAGRPLSSRRPMPPCCPK